MITFLLGLVKRSGNMSQRLEVGSSGPSTSNCPVTSLLAKRAWEASSKAVRKIRFSSGAANEPAMKWNAPWDSFQHALRAGCEARGRQFIKRSA